MIVNNFAQEIESLCRDKKIEYIDAVVLWCTKNNVEIEVAATWIKKEPTLKSRIQEEAENINILKKGAQLPI